MAANERQSEAARLQREGLTRREIAVRLGITVESVKGLLGRYRKWQAADSALADGARAIGADSPASMVWSKQQKDGTVLYSVMHNNKPVQMSPSEYADELKECLAGLPALPPLPPAQKTRNGKCNFLPLADLHLGGQYGCEDYIDAVLATLDDLISRLPAAQEAKIIELGDLMDANDHKGVTPASGNPCDVKRDEHLKNTNTAIRVVDYAIQRLLERHSKVEIHILPGNHDETAYIAVMVGLSERYRDNPAVNVVVTDDIFRVVQWGGCAIFPHHGHKARWEALKEVFTDQFPDEYAAAKAARFIWTAHFHHDRSRDLGKVHAEHFRTTYPANKWARELGLFNVPGLCAVTLHKEYGQTDRTSAMVCQRGTA